MIIDLGEWGDSRPPPVALPAGSPAVRRRRARWLAPAVALLTLVALAGSAPPVERLRERWGLPSVWIFDQTADTLVAYDYATRAVTAYRLADGAPRWHRDGLDNPWILVVDDRVGIASDVPSGWPRVEWVDAATGRGGVTINDSVIGEFPDGWFLTLRGDMSGTEFFRVSPDTGERHALLRLTTDVVWDTDPAARRIAWWDTKGVLRVRDLTTGVESRRDTDLRPTLPAPGGYLRGGISYHGGDWLLTEQVEGRIRVGSFEGTALIPRWTVGMPAQYTMESGEPFFSYAYGCGPEVCVSPAVGRTVFLDPADGRTRRELPYELSAIGSTAWQLVNTAAAAEEPHSTVINVLTGRMPYPSWEYLGETRVGSGRHLMRLDLGNRTGLGVFDEATGELTWLAAIPGPLNTCRLRPPYLTCQIASATTSVRVWEVRTGG
ncbi:hypothetical protein GCM10009681_49450 [Luedemannella helvata]|uniref:Uncharacterized protein n=2 Tax=Luedemannella helvata TaxID=349315 RepID=A0ABP4X7I7_9ACTN